MTNDIRISILYEVKNSQRFCLNFLDVELCLLYTDLHNNTLVDNERRAVMVNKYVSLDQSRLNSEFDPYFILCYI